MNPAEKPEPSILSAPEYILDNFEHTDRIAVLVLNREFGETIQRITSAQKAASPEFQAWLRYKNANGSDIYIGMNPLKKDAATRTKEEIESTRRGQRKRSSRSGMFISIWITAARKPLKLSRIPASCQSQTTC